MTKPHFTQKEILHLTFMSNDVTPEELKAAFQRRKLDGTQEIHFIDKSYRTFEDFENGKEMVIVALAPYDYTSLLRIVGQSTDDVDTRKHLLSELSRV